MKPRSHRDTISRLTALPMRLTNAHSERSAKRARSSVGLGAVPPTPLGRHNNQESSKRTVDRIRVREYFRYVRFQQDDVRAFPVSGRVLSAHAATKVVLRPHAVTARLSLTSLPHMFVSLGGSPAAH